jgi:hypothetical protein
VISSTSHFVFACYDHPEFLTSLLAGVFASRAYNIQACMLLSFDYCLEIKKIEIAEIEKTSHILLYRRQTVEIFRENIIVLLIIFICSCKSLAVWHAETDRGISRITTACEFVCTQ